MADPSGMGPVLPELVGARPMVCPPLLGTSLPAGQSRFEFSFHVSNLTASLSLPLPNPRWRDRPIVLHTPPTSVSGPTHLETNKMQFPAQARS